MRLADHILAAARDRRHPLQPDYERLAAAIQPALHLEVTPPAGRVAAGIGAADAAMLRDYHPLAIAPALVTWIEWAGVSNDFYDHHEPLQPGQARPDRCGLLIETDASRQRGTVSQFWHGTGPGGRTSVEVSPLCVAFDYRAEPGPVPTIMPPDRSRPLFPGGKAKDPGDKRTEAQLSTLSRDEIHAELSRLGFIPNDRVPLLQEGLDTAAREDAVRAMLRCLSIIRDWHGELNFMHALLVCLNAKGALRIGERENRAEMNRARRRLGRPTMLEFSLIQPCGETA